MEQRDSSGELVDMEVSEFELLDGRGGRGRRRRGELLDVGRLVGGAGDGVFGIGGKGRMTLPDVLCAATSGLTSAEGRHLREL